MKTINTLDNEPVGLSGAETAISEDDTESINNLRAR